MNPFLRFLNAIMFIFLREVRRENEERKARALLQHVVDSQLKVQDFHRRIREDQFHLHWYSDLELEFTTF